jgi:hypothetical protein
MGRLDLTLPRCWALPIDANMCSKIHRFTEVDRTTVLHTRSAVLEDIDNELHRPPKKPTQHPTDRTPTEVFTICLHMGIGIQVSVQTQAGHFSFGVWPAPHSRRHIIQLGEMAPPILTLVRLAPRLLGSVQTHQLMVCCFDLFFSSVTPYAASCG